MTGPRVVLIAAVARNGVIGAGGRLPWRVSSDLKRFKQLTLGHPVIMGHKTFASIGKPLPGRLNIVVTRRGGTAPGGVVFAASVEDAVAVARNRMADADDEAMVIGGGEIYAAAINRADRLYITHVEATPDGDTYFPDIDPAVWKSVRSEHVPAGDNDSAPTTFTVYERVSGGNR